MEAQKYGQIALSTNKSHNIPSIDDPVISMVVTSHMSHSIAKIIHETSEESKQTKNRLRISDNSIYGFMNGNSNLFIQH